MQAVEIWKYRVQKCPKIVLGNYSCWRVVPKPVITLCKQTIHANPQSWKLSTSKSLTGENAILSIPRSADPRTSLLLTARKNLSSSSLVVSPFKCSSISSILSNFLSKTTLALEVRSSNQVYIITTTYSLFWTTLAEALNCTACSTRASSVAAASLLSSQAYITSQMD